MKLYFNIPSTLQPFYSEELRLANKFYKENNLQQAWHHYERAHILGQKYPLQHMYTHWKMLQYGIKIKSKKEVFGQITRLVFGGIFSFFGKVPIGNTGGSNVPPLMPMEIPKDLQEILLKHS
ncbi:MAG: DUF3703 domain-containing protein [Chitinophagaceae bacterium]